jgi:hypothetical protein
MYKWVVDKCDAAVLVVYSNIELTPTCTSHDIGLDLLFIESSFKTSIFERGNECKKATNFDR